MSHKDPCHHLACFLYERTGGVCPTARDAYGLHNSAEAERRAERFRVAITQDAQSTVGLNELIALDAARQSVGSELVASRRLALLSPGAPSVSQDSRREKVHASISRTAQ